MGTFKRVNDKAAFKNLAVPQGGDLLYDEEVKQVAAKTGTDYLVKTGDVKPLLPTHCFQTLVPQLKMDDLPLPLMKGTVQGGLPLRTDVLYTPSPLRNQISAKNHWGEVLNFFLYEDHNTIFTFCQVIILLYTI